MDTTAPEHIEEGGGGVPPALRQRLTWRPPAVRGADALLFGIADRARPMLAGVARLEQWHGRFARRVRPGWTSVAAPPLDAEGRSEVEPGWAQELGPEHLRQAPQASPGLSSSAGEGELRRGGSRDIPNPVPPLELAILRETPVGPGGGAFVNMHEGSLRIESLERIFPAVERVTPAPRAMLPEETRIGENRPLEFRLATTVMANPRREVRGGFPHPGGPGESPAAGRVEREQGGAVRDGRDIVTGLPLRPAAAAAGTARKGSPAAHLPGDNAFAGTTTQPALPSKSDFRSEPQGGLEKFLEQYVVPTPMPGLAMRLLEPAPEVLHSRPPDSRERNAERQETPATAPPAAPQAPPLDINAIAERVYQTLRRRDQLERERRGLS
ncbi:hypothetical protein [Geobacter sp.]|uniref:hypothetical protein n=1 Tax=Geobacter sp. TaxID=46610 RepID=UPI00262FF5D7|nr:hypothetical protein [Geobacter sp.]